MLHLTGATNVVIISLSDSSVLSDVYVSTSICRITHYISIVIEYTYRYTLDYVSQTRYTIRYKSFITQWYESVKMHLLSYSLESSCVNDQLAHCQTCNTEYSQLNKSYM